MYFAGRSKNLRASDSEVPYKAWLEIKAQISKVKIAGEHESS